LKPSPFDYVRPQSLDEALTVLGVHGDNSKVLAGGQSLIPMLNFRIASPERLIDINQLSQLAYLRRRAGILYIGALTRHATLENSRLVARSWPLLHEAIGWVAHPQIRNRGTIGGSVAHADSAAELPVALVALDATFKARSLRGERIIDWRDFFVSALTTALRPDELLVEIQVPATKPRHGFSFEEYSRRNGDFALAGAAVSLSLDETGRCADAAIGLLGAALTPVRAERAEALLRGSQLDAASASAAAAAAAEASSPGADVHGSVEYRKRLLEVLVCRAVVTAARRAKENL
jgi:CO/xanthine dehydrogenase FAD-binding subunit